MDDDQSDAEDRAQSMNLEDGEHEIEGSPQRKPRPKWARRRAWRRRLRARRAARGGGAEPGFDAGARGREPNVSGGMKPQGDDDDDDEYGNGGDGSGAPVAEGMYDPAEYANLQVSGEIKELFQYITRYKPHNIELETKMRPFIPDYVESKLATSTAGRRRRAGRRQAGQAALRGARRARVGAVRPDGADAAAARGLEGLGAVQPMTSARSSTPRRTRSSSPSGIHSISDLHRHKPAPTVRYAKPMPDIEALMQIWPKVEGDILEQNPLPDADTELDLKAYVRIVCAMLDIPGAARSPSRCTCSSRSTPTSRRTSTSSSSSPSSRWVTGWAAAAWAAARWTAAWAAAALAAAALAGRRGRDHALS